MSEKPASSSPLPDQFAPEDLLDFEPYTNSLVDIIRDPNTKGPLVVGVYGSWGSGKTSLMRFVQAALPSPNAVEEKNNAEGSAKASSGFRAVWFDAWKFDKEQELWRALLMRVIDSLRTRDGDEETTPPELKEAIDRLEQRFYRDVEWKEKGGITVDWPSLGVGVAQGSAKLALNCIPGANTLAELFEAAKEGLEGKKEKSVNGLFKAFRRDMVSHHQAQLRSLAQFQDEFKKLVKEHILSKGQRLVVFVDDLDRCLPQKAIEVLEAIKLFLDVEGCIFLLGLDHDVVTRGIEAKYKDFVVEDEDSEERGRRLLIKGDAYLEKIIQLPFRLPPINLEIMQRYVESLATFEDRRCSEVFGVGLETNPRKVKRAINIFLFLSNLARHADIPVTPVRLAKIVVIQLRHAELYKSLEKIPNNLRIVEESLLQAKEREASKDRKGGQFEEGRTEEQSYPVASRLLSDEAKRVLSLFLEDEKACFRKLSPSERDPYFTLTRDTGEEKVDPSLSDQEASTAEAALGFVRIPAGEFIMGTTDVDIEALVSSTDWAKKWKKGGHFADEQPSHRVRVDAFQMGRYPVTNSDYAAFVKAKKGKASSHWSGREVPEGLAAHPVVRIDWNDARDYCEWLTGELKASGTIGESEAVRLPSEAEWEYAARGNDGRFWPWGKEWDSSNCNSRENDTDSTTPVGQYSPSGDSPFGLADMTGNVWEWCQDVYSGYSSEPVSNPQGPRSGSERVLRGGSWFLPAERCRSAYRLRNSPSDRDSRVGFRVVLARSSGERSGEREDREAEERSP